MVSGLQTLALEVYSLCITNNISLCSAWVPRDNNQAADALSKTIDPDDWSVSDRIFKYFTKVYGPFSLDVFANNHNSKCNTFFSRWWCEGSSGIDAFCHSWEKHYCWIVPPPNLLTRVILFCLKHKVKGILIFPRWESAAFWPLLFPQGKLLKGFSIVQEFRRPSNFFVPGPFRNNIFSCHTFSGDVIALKIDCQD